MKEDSPQGIWDNIAEKMLLEFAENGCPIFRAATRLLKAKDLENCRFTLLSFKNKLIFRIMFLHISSVFTEQSRKCVENINLFTIDQDDLNDDGTINCAQ